MSELCRDTVFGHIVRLVTAGKYLQYAEEKDPSLWKQYLDREGTKNMALHGHPERPAEESDKKVQSERTSPAEQASNSITTSSAASSRTHSEEQKRNPLSSTITGQKIDPEKGRDTSIVTWFGDNDPENPLNWSMFKKVFVTFEICLLTFSVYIGSAIYSAGTETVVRDFGVSQTQATLGLTLFVAGYGIGPMLWAPLSEIPQIGRNLIYIGTLIVFVGFQVPTALAVNFAMLLCFRFLTGFIGSPALATGGASIGDMFTPKKRAYAIGIWGVAAICGPVLGPLVGGFAAQAKWWSWTIWELMWLSGLSLIFLRCQAEIVGEQMTTKEIALTALIRPLTVNFTEPIVFLLNLYIALTYGLLYIWFESFPIVFTGIYNFKLGEEGLAFVGLLVGDLLVMPPFFYYVYKVLEPQFKANGELKPENRLPPAMLGAFCVPICLFWFGWSARPQIHWIMPIIGSALVLRWNLSALERCVELSPGCVS